MGRLRIDEQQEAQHDQARHRHQEGGAVMRPTEPGGVPYPVQNGIGDGQAAPFRNSGAGLPFGQTPCTLPWPRQQMTVSHDTIHPFREGFPVDDRGG